MMVKLCKDCRWSTNGKNEYDFCCRNPKVNRWNWSYISAKEPTEKWKYTYTVRRNLIFSCGILGRYWEPREDSTNN